MKPKMKLNLKLGNTPIKCEARLTRSSSQSSLESLDLGAEVKQEIKQEPLSPVETSGPLFSMVTIKPDPDAPWKQGRKVRATSRNPVSGGSSPLGVHVAVAEAHAVEDRIIEV